MLERCTTMLGHYKWCFTRTIPSWLSRMIPIISGKSARPTTTHLTTSVWDWKAQVKLNKFSNQNVYGSSISSAHFINEMASSLMLTASSMSHSLQTTELTVQPRDVYVYGGIMRRTQRRNSPRRSGPSRTCFPWGIPVES